MAEKKKEKGLKKEKAVKKKEVKPKVEKKVEKPKVEKVEKKELIKVDLGKGKPKIYEIIRYPLITEKAVNMIEAENKLVFVVNGKAEKNDVKKAVEMLYGVKVDKVNILRDMSSRKRAIVKINKAYKADELATKLGVL